MYCRIEYNKYDKMSRYHPIHDRQEATVTMFAGHIIVAIFAESTDPVLGLRNLVMPLRSKVEREEEIPRSPRASNIPYGDLRHIIIVGNMDFIRSTTPGASSPPHQHHHDD